MCFMQERMRTHWNVEEMFLDNDVSMSANVLIFYRKFSYISTLTFTKQFSFAPASLCASYAYVCVNLWLWFYDWYKSFWISIYLLLLIKSNILRCIVSYQCLWKECFDLSAMQYIFYYLQIFDSLLVLVSYHDNCYRYYK